MIKMTSNKPYLIRAIYEWLVDNELTPYILVNVDYPGVEVPQDYVTGNRIILNISPKSSRGLHLDNDKILFTTKFAGQSVQIFIPTPAVLAIYAKENGRGMDFGDEEGTPPPTPTQDQDNKKHRKPILKIVK